MGLFLSFIMKNYITIFIFLFSFFLFSQQKNKQNLLNLSNNFNIDYLKQKKKIFQFAVDKNLPIFIHKDSSFKELVRILDDGTPIYFTTYNFAASISSRANTLRTGGILGLNINGESMTAYVWDGGVALSSHQEFMNSGNTNTRYSLIDSGAVGLSDHATHVTGTIMAKGVVQNAMGMAPLCNVKGADWDNDLSEVAIEAANGMLLSNHSYGNFNTTIPDYWFGAYIDESRNWDLIMYNAPYYLMVCAAGNDGNDNSSNGAPLEGQTQYDKLNGKATVKNNLVIANANDANIDQNGDLISVAINTSSSQGPTDDYRIKPDLAGNGTQLYSSISTGISDYDSYTGTSMATPNVTGTLLLLQQYYNSIFNTYMKAATIKGLVLHTADDAGTQGPDPKFGWGLINAKKAAVLINDTQLENSVISELDLQNNDTFSISVLSNDIDILKASISWTDPAGEINTGTVNDNTPVLVNDLDIRISKAGDVFLPYKLNSVLTNTLGDNIVDPYERIDVDNASGLYTITISHKGTLSNGHQNFSLIISGIQYNGTCQLIPPSNFSVGDILFGNTTLSWDFVPGVSSYEIRYKEHDLSDWNILTTNQNNIQLTNISGSTLYDAQIRSVCSDGTYSEYSSTLFFPSYLNVNPDLLDNKNLVKISNNKDYVILETLDHSNILNVYVYDYLGKLIFSRYVNDINFQMNKHKFTSYNIIFLKIELDNQKLVQKKIIVN